MAGSRERQQETRATAPTSKIGIEQLAKVYYYCLRGCLNRQVPHQGLQFDLNFAFLKVEDIRDVLADSLNKTIDCQSLIDWLNFFALGHDSDDKTEKRSLLEAFKLLLELILQRTSPYFTFSPQSKLHLVADDIESSFSPDLFASDQASMNASSQRPDLKVLYGVRIDDKEAKARLRYTKSATPEPSKVRLNLHSDKKRIQTSEILRTYKKQDSWAMFDKIKKAEKMNVSELLSVGKGRGKMDFAPRPIDQRLQSSNHGAYGYITPSLNNSAMADSQLMTSQIKSGLKKPNVLKRTADTDLRTSASIMFNPSERQDSALNRAIRKLGADRLPSQNRDADLPFDQVQRHLENRKKEKIHLKLGSPGDLNDHKAKNPLEPFTRLGHLSGHSKYIDRDCVRKREYLLPNHSPPSVAHFKETIQHKLSKIGSLQRDYSSQKKATNRL